MQPAATPAPSAADRGCGIGCLGLIIAFVLWLIIGTFKNASDSHDAAAARLDHFESEHKAVEAENKELQWRLNSAKRNHDDYEMRDLKKRIDAHARRTEDLIREKQKVDDLVGGKRKDGR